MSVSNLHRLQPLLELDDELKERDAQRLQEVVEFEHVDPSYAAFYPTDLGLMHLQPLRELHLCHPDRDARVVQ